MHSDDLKPYASSKEFTNAVDTALEAALVAHGFTRFRKGVLVYPISEDFIGWIGMPRIAKYARFGVIDVLTNWGIHCPVIERFIAESHGEPYKRGAVCTVPPAMYTPPRTRKFQFFAKGNLENTALDVAQFYRNEVLPSMQAHASYDAIIPILEDLAPSWGGRDQSLLLAYHLSGNTTQAKAYTHERKTACLENAEYAAYYQPFLASVIDHFGE